MKLFSTHQLSRLFLSFIFCLSTMTIWAQVNALVLGTISNAKLIKEIDIQVNHRYIDDNITTYTSSISEEGKFGFAVEISEPQFITILYARNMQMIYLEPNDTLIINCDANNFQYSFRFEGKSKDNNQVFAQYLKANPIVLDPFQLIQYKKGTYWYAVAPKMDELMRTKTPADFDKTIRIQKEKSLQALDFYHQNHPRKLSDSFRDFLATDIIYRWAYNKLLYGHVYKNKYGIDEKYFEFLDELPIQNKNISNFWYREFLKAYMNFKCLEEDKNTQEYAGQYELATKILSDRTLAFFRSEIIAKAFSKKKIEEIIPKYVEFLRSSSIPDFDHKVVTAYDKAIKYAVGTVAPNFSLTDNNSHQISLDQFKGKVVYLNFWASWCRPCLNKMSNTNTIYDELSNKDVVFLNISLDKDEASWKKAIEQWGFKGIHLLANSNPAANVVKLYDVTALPKYFIINKLGSFAQKPDKPDLEKLKTVLVKDAENN